MTLLSGHKAVSSYAFAENYKEGPVEIELNPGQKLVEVYSRLF